jgi:MYXO-CTERM domain-containing protein
VLIAVDGPHSDFTGAPLVAMNWSSNLTSAGGTVGLNTAGFSFLGTCGSVSCGNVATAIGFASGSITTTSPVPDVSSWALLLVGLGFVGSSARRRQVRNQT